MPYSIYIFITKDKRLSSSFGRVRILMKYKNREMVNLILSGLYFNKTITLFNEFGRIE